MTQLLPLRNVPRVESRILDAPYIFDGYRSVSESDGVGALTDQRGVPRARDEHLDIFIGGRLGSDVYSHSVVEFGRSFRRDRSGVVAGPVDREGHRVRVTPEQLEILRDAFGLFYVSWVRQTTLFGVQNLENGTTRGVDQLGRSFDVYSPVDRICNVASHQVT